jgi:hypothetical protein
MFKVHNTIPIFNGRPISFLMKTEIPNFVPIPNGMTKVVPFFYGIKLGLFYHAYLDNNAYAVMDRLEFRHHGPNQIFR